MILCFVVNVMSFVVMCLFNLLFFYVMERMSFIVIISEAEKIIHTISETELFHSMENTFFRSQKLTEFTILPIQFSLCPPIYDICSSMAPQQLFKVDGMVSYSRLTSGALRSAVSPFSCCSFITTRRNWPADV